MKITPAGLDGVFIIEPVAHGDARGWFAETFRADRAAEFGAKHDFVQDNHAFSAPAGTLRGIHFQNFPKAQSKLVRCLRGSVLDIAVDLRPESPNYKKWVSVILSAENKRQLFVPRGFGHAYLTLEENCEVAYKVDEYYDKASDRGIRFDDPALAVNWGRKNLVLSDKDKIAPALDDCDCNFGSRVLVTGAAGQLGSDVVKRLRQKSVPCLGVDIKDFDLTDAAATLGFVQNYRPDIIVHCAAYTAVDKAEDETEACFAVNEQGTRSIALAAKAVGAKIVYISTDYVYGGMGDTPNSETQTPSPLNVYGRSKLNGEHEVIAATDKHFILRTSWVFGSSGNNFVKTMLRLAKDRPEIGVVCDQIGSPTYTVDLAVLAVDMMFGDKYGIYNASNEGFCSWADFAAEIFRQSGISVRVKPVASAEYPTRAARPLNSRLDKSKLEQNGFKRLPDWKDALKRFLKGNQT